MSQQLQPTGVDTELLELAEVVLHQSGYEVVRQSFDGAAYLLGEDPDNVVVLAAVVAVDDVFAAEPALTRVLSTRLAAAPAESKKWDGYVVVITGARPEDAIADVLSSITHNLHQVRRIIRVGVDATTAAVARSLRAILPMSEALGEERLLDPLTALVQRLVRDGLAVDEVDTAIAAFRATTDSRSVSGVPGTGIDDGDDGLGPDGDVAVPGGNDD